MSATRSPTRVLIAIRLTETSRVLESILSTQPAKQTGASSKASCGSYFSLGERYMLSYACGPKGPQLEQTIPQALMATAERFPSQEAIVIPHQNVRLTWPELVRQTERTARGLLGLGLQRGDRVGIWSSNCLEWILTQYACAWAGLVLVNVNPAYRARDVSFILAKSRMRALVLHECDARADYRRILEEARSTGTFPLEHVIWLDQDAWRNLVSNDGRLPPLAADPDDVVNIQYTSGTTGSPKGVLLTHRGLLNNAASMAAWLDYSERDRCCWPFPLYHCAGCVLGVLSTMTAGAALILPSAQFDPLAVLETIEAERATILSGVPTMFIAELERPEFARFDLSSLRAAVMGGSPCPVELMKRVLVDMHCRDVSVVYGQTEASPVITMSPPGEAARPRISAAGCTMPNGQVKVGRSGTGGRIVVGEEGEICARGYLVMKGCDGEPDATARTIDADGWLHTGDLGVMLPD